jgi:hypothetical protein
VPDEGSSHFAWEMFKLTAGVILILFAAIYTIVRFLDSVMHERPEDQRCGDRTMLSGADGEYVVICDRAPGHVGYHHDSDRIVDWSDASVEAEVAP